MQSNVPTLDDLNRFGISNGNVETIRQSLYDTAVMPLAGSVQLAFFANPVGQGLSAAPGNATNPKTRADTNMTLAGQLPTAQAFLIESIEVDFQPGNSAVASTFTLLSPITFAAVAAATVTSGIDDVGAFYNSGFLVLSIMSKDYLTEAPLGRFPPKAHREIDLAIASNSATTSEVFAGLNKAVGRPYYMEVPLPLKAGQNFGVTLNWPVAVALPSGKNGAARVIMDGFIYRQSQ